MKQSAMLYLRNTFRFACCLFVACAMVPIAALADWPGFLGPGGNPVISDSSLPLDFSIAAKDNDSKNIAWKTPLQGKSVSSPIVVGGRVFTTSSSAMEGRWIHVTAVDADSGEVVWHRSTKATGRPFCHPTSANAAPTPCSDGERVYAFFSCNDLVCYDLDGNLQWFRSLVDSHPLVGNDVGMGSSPVVVEGVVVVTVECQTDAFTAGIDVLTGETLWEVPRPRKANWASPRIATGTDGRSVVILHGLDNLIGIDPKSGKQVWEIDLRCSSIATAVFADGKLYVPAGGVKVFEMAGGLEEPRKIWETSRVNSGSASLLAGPLGLLGLNGSILVCCDETGERRWSTRLKDAGKFWATPVVAGEHLYAFAMNGKCFTVRLGEKQAEVVAESELGTEVLGSPAISDGALYVRSTDALWKISKDDS